MLKQFSVAFLFSLLCSVTLGQNVGIGTTSPLARLHVTDSNVVFSGPVSVPVSTPFLPSVEGAGARTVWYSQKAAFRSGYVNGNQWDGVFVGRFSFAIGQNNIALGESTFSAGTNSTASGQNSTAIGYNAIAFGNNATAIGNNPFASGENSFATGFQTRATGYNSSVFGTNSESSGSHSLAAGSFNKAIGNATAVFGENNKAKSFYSTVVGRYNDTTAINSLFEIGTGTSDVQRRNALTVLDNGMIGINTINPQAGLHVDRQNVVFTAAGLPPGVAGNTPVSGAGRRMMWYADKAAFRVGYISNIDWDKDNIGMYSFAAGQESVAKAQAATAIGASTALKPYSTALGNAYADGDMSTALGQGYSFGQYSLAVGNGYSVGDFSFSVGKSVHARAFGSVTMGAYADLSDNPGNTEFTAQQTDRIFQLGNGTESISRNAITVLRNGRIGIGTTTPTCIVDIRGGNNWNLPGSEGDFRIGNDFYRLKIGVALGGVGAGAVGVHAAGGIERLNLGAANTNILSINGASLSVGIGTETPSQKLHVIGNILASGTITPSDIRYKKDIVAIQQPLQKIELLNGYTYHYRNDEFPSLGFDDKQQLGLIAQEVEKVFPQLVFTDGSGYKAVDYVKLVPVLLEGIKELNHKSATQQQQIDDLKKMVEQLIKK